jgi:isoquinoline 1-oxidoreductase beta subunit
MALADSLLNLNTSSSMSRKTISRRDFLRVTGLAGTVFSIGFYFPAVTREAKILKAEQAANEEIELNAWIQINTSGKVTLFSHRAEMGQGVYQSLPQILAEELEVDLDEVDIAFAQGDNKKYGNQVTGGSSSVRTSYKNLLKLGATAREMLITAAATKWSVPASECYAQSGHVFHKPSGKKRIMESWLLMHQNLKRPQM